MVQEFYKFFNKVFDNDNCKIRRASEESKFLRDGCHALHLGRLIQIHQRIGQAAPVPRRTEKEMNEASAKNFASMDTTFDNFSYVDVMTFIEKPSDTARSHATCNFSAELEQEIRQAYIGGIRGTDPVPESHRKHMETQWKKGHLETEDSNIE